MPSRILVRTNCTATRMNRKLSKMRPGTLEIKSNVRLIDIFYRVLTLPKVGQ